MSANTAGAAGERQPLLPAGDFGSNDVSATEAGFGDDATTTNGNNATTTTTTTSFRRNLGTVEAFAIVISIVIGSGIFTSPGAVDTNVPSPGAALGVWLVGGLLAWTGAATLAELGTAIPGEGGVQPFLQYVYGDVFGFLAAWTWLVAVMPATLAILSIVFVESLFSAGGVQAETAKVLGSPLLHKALSIAVLAAATLANSVSTKASARLNNVFVATKFLAVAAVVIAAVVVMLVQTARHTAHDHDWRSRPWFAPRAPSDQAGDDPIDWSQISTWGLLGHYAAALYSALWAYSGWDKALYVSAELAHPARQLPRALHTALPLIVACFLAANAAYYVLLPWRVVASTDSVAVTAFARLLGAGGGIVAAILVCLVVAGSLLGNSFVAGRMAVSAAHKHWIPVAFGLLGRLGRPAEPEEPAEPPTPELPAVSAASLSTTTIATSNDRHSTYSSFTDLAPPKPPAPPPSESDSDAPINALTLAAVLATVYIIFGNFRALLTFNGLGEFTFFFLTVLGAIILRIREPELARPYKPPILVPITFTVVSGLVVLRGAAFAPLLSLVLVVLWLLGLAYYWWRRRTGQTAQE